MMKDYTMLAELLRKEKYPMRYMHKFVGKNSPAFTSGVSSLERRFPKAKRQSERKSANDQHVAMTFVLDADSADEILELLKATETIDDILMML